MLYDCGNVIPISNIIWYFGSCKINKLIDLERKKKTEVTVVSEAEMGHLTLAFKPSFICLFLVVGVLLSFQSFSIFHVSPKTKNKTKNKKQKNSFFLPLYASSCSLSILLLHCIPHSYFRYCLMLLN